MKVSEIFHSISGEGVHAGIPTAFVRLAGCNLDCTWCDTKYAHDDGKEMSILQVVSCVWDFWAHGDDTEWVLITGGEPLYQTDEVFGLICKLPRRYSTEIETNGSYVPPHWFSLVNCWSVDVKCPSSGSYGTFKTVWLKRLRKRDQLKFVVANERDLDFVRGFLNGRRFKPTVLVSPIADLVRSPMWDRKWLQRVAEFCKEQNVRLSLQLHKIIYGNRRGV